MPANVAENANIHSERKTVYCFSASSENCIPQPVCMACYLYLSFSFSFSFSFTFTFSFLLLWLKYIYIHSFSFSLHFFSKMLKINHIFLCHVGKKLYICISKKGKPDASFEFIGKIKSPLICSSESRDIEEGLISIHSSSRGAKILRFILLSKFFQSFFFKRLIINN